MQITTFKQICGRVYRATCVALDKLLIGDWEWKWVGKGDALFNREIEIDGITYVADLSIDRETRPLHLGSFGADEKPGSLDCGDGRYYYPEKTEGKLIAEMVAHGMTGRQACREARRQIDNAYFWASSFGTDWFYYKLNMMAKSGELPLAQISLSGINAKLYGLKMDPQIDHLFYKLLTEAKQDVVKALAQINVRKFDSYTETN